MFHILVVDDDKHTRMLLRAILENASYTVSAAENGEEALDVLDREHIDLVVLDVMMPKMNGYEFTKIIRNGNDALPILMVTAKALPADEKQGFLVGTDDYITKPIDEEKLLLRIKALLRRGWPCCCWDAARCATWWPSPSCATAHVRSPRVISILSIIMPLS